MNHQKTIVIKSTSEVLEFEFYNPKSKVFIYKYTKAITKLGRTLEMTEDILIKLIKINT